MLTLRVSLGVILLVFLTSPTAAQVSMEWSRPQPQGNPVLEFVEGPPGTVFGLTDQGTLLISDDGGSTWSIRYQFEGYAATYSIAYTLDGALYVGGEFGLKRSYDLGLSWTDVPTPAAAVASVVQPVPIEGTLTICDGAYVHASLDHGATWSTSARLPDIASDLRFVDQHWFDFGGGRIVHDQGGYLTQDGGGSWSGMLLQGQPTGIGVIERAVSMHWTGAPWGPWGGILIAQPVNSSPFRLYVFISSDGRHWEYAGGRGDVGLALGADRFLRGEGGVVLETTDRGETWTELYRVLDPYILTSLGTSGANLLAAGDGGAIFQSTDDGVTWTDRITAGDGLANLGPISVGTTFGIALREGDELMTLDGGQSWTPVQQPVADEQLVVAHGSDIGAVAGDDHFVALTFDAGATWEIEEVPVEVPPDFVPDGPIDLRAVPGTGDISIVSRNWGEWGATDKHLLVRDHATGIWEPREAGLERTIYSHAWATSQVGFAACYLDLYRTLDQGHSWQYVAELPGNYPRGTRDLVAASETDLFYIANCGTPNNLDPVCVYRSTDGGFTWSIVEQECDDPPGDPRSVIPTEMGVLDGGVVVIAGGKAVGEPRLTYFDPDDTVTCVDLPLTHWGSRGIGVTGFGADRVFVAKDFGALLAVDRTIVDVPQVPGVTGGPRLTMISRNGSRFGFEVEFERAGHGALRVFDVAGREVRTLWSGSLRAASPVRADWDGRTDSGAPAATGMYYVHLTGESGSRTIRVPIIR